MPQPCPHEAVNAEGRFVCAILHAAGYHSTAAPTSPVSPCRRCRSEWEEENQPPTLENATPTLLRMIANAPEDRRSPSFPVKLVTFARATVRHVAHGCPETDPEELASRLAACEACESFVDGDCVECGCSTAKKASWKLEKCPLGKW